MNFNNLNIKKMKKKDCCYRLEKKVVFIMDKRKITKNYFFDVSYQVFALIVPIILTPYISRTLGVEQIGIYSFTYSIVSYFVLIATLGSSTFAVKKIGEYKDFELRSISFFNVFIFRLFTSTLSLLAYILYSVFIMNCDLIVLLQCFYIINVIFDITWFYQGMEKYKNISIKNFVFKILSVIFIFIFVKDSNDLYLYIIGLVAFTILGNVSMWIGIRKHVNFKCLKKCKPFKNTKEIITMFFPTIAPQLFVYIDKTLIGVLITEENIVVDTVFINGISYFEERIVKVSNIENGYYEQAEKIINMSSMLIISLAYVNIPQISYAFKNSDDDSIRNLLNNSFKFLWFLSIVMYIGVVCVSDYFTPLFFGEGYDKISTLLKILGLFYIFKGINNIVGIQYLISTGKEKIFSIFLIISGIINVFLKLILIPNYYSIGACIASVIGEFTLSVLCIIYVLKNMVLSFKDVLGDVWKNVISGVVMIVIMESMKLFMSISWVNLLLLVFFGSLTYIVVLLFFKNEFIFDIFRLLRKKINGER